MFATLKGIVSIIEEDYVVLDVNGVGYLVSVPLGSKKNMVLGEVATLHIQTLVKEDSISLYGFLDVTQKKIFNLLITVQGVGAKIALLVLSKITIADLHKAIVFEDTKTLKEIPGIGIKVAQRIVNELKDKIGKISLLDSLDATERTSISTKDTKVQDAIAVLEGLGYSNFEINKMMAKLDSVLNKNATAEDIIKEALQFFAKGI